MRVQPARGATGTEVGRRAGSPSGTQLKANLEAPPNETRGSKGKREQGGRNWPSFKGKAGGGGGAKRREASTRTRGDKKPHPAAADEKLVREAKLPMIEEEEEEEDIIEGRGNEVRLIT